MQPTVITPYENGPLIVRGPFVLADEDGREVEVGRRTVALCRCGRSRLRPFCDGSHLTGNFTAEGGLSEEARRRHVAMTGRRPEAVTIGPPPTP